MRRFAKSKFVLVTVFFMVVLAALFFSNFSRNLALLHGTKSVNSGSFLGLNIGDSEDTIKPQLERIGLSDETNWFTFDERVQCKANADLIVENTFVFQDRSWRNGLVCVSVVNGYIIEIYSQYSGIYL